MDDDKSNLLKSAQELVDSGATLSQEQLLVVAEARAQSLVNMPFAEAVKRVERGEYHGTAVESEILSILSLVEHSPISWSNRQRDWEHIQAIKAEISEVKYIISQTPENLFGDGGLSHRLAELEDELYYLIRLYEID